MNRRAAHTLVELLTMLAITSVVFAITFRLFVDGWQASRHALRQAETRQRVALVMNRWQREIRGTRPDQWRVEGATFRAGDRWVRREKDDLVFGDAARAASVFLPASVGCAFAIERKAGLADCAVLTLALPAHRQRRVNTHSVRIVACGGGPPP